MSEHHSIAFEAMNELRKSEELCNFKIVVEGKTIQVHRVVLASCSEYFRKMFNIPMRECNEGVCQMKDTTAEVAEICVNFMYTGEMDVKPDVADEVLKLSHMWRLDKAVDICVEVMSKNLSSTNCVSILKLGKLYSLQTLTDNCIRYILWNISSILEEVRDLDCSDMQDILKYSNSEGETLCTPWELWALYFMWSTSTHHDIYEVMKSFPVEKLSYTDFATSVWEDSHIWECECCRKNVGERYTNSCPTITVENCLFLKHLDNCYGVGPNTLTEFIVRESEKVFVQPEFESFTTLENLMEYISRFGEEKKRMLSC